MPLTRENVLRLWASEEYKKLSRKLIEQSSGDLLQYTHVRKNITNPDIVLIDELEYTVEEIIEFLDSIMEPFKKLKSKERKYFRGDTNLIPNTSCMKENYISVSKNIEDAIAFIDNPSKSFLSEVTIDSNVKCVQVGVEGELLLEHGCLWEVKSQNFTTKVDGVKYKTIKVHIHPPNSYNNDSKYPACSLLKSKKINKSVLSKTKTKTNTKTKTKMSVSKRLRPFYQAYVEEAQLMSESENENNFLDTITHMNNISNQQKRKFYQKVKSRNNLNQNTNLNSNSNSSKGVFGKKRKSKKKRVKRILSSP